jgi:cytochrome c5
MRVEATTRTSRLAGRVHRVRRHIASIAIASALLATAAATACRTAGGGAKVNAMAPPPALQATLTSAEAAEIAALPDGPAKVLITERCMLCHGPGLITQQRKDAAAWGRAVTQMRTWGTPIQDEDQAAIVSYLTQHFGPNAARR